MKIKILEYKVWKGDKVKVQSYNKRKGKWKPNPNWDFHKKVASDMYKIQFGVMKDSVKEYEVERNDN